MEELSFLNTTIEFVRSINLTPIIALYFVLGCILSVAIYYLSGTSDNVENLSTSKKFMLFIFLLIFFGFIYYIIYQAGKFDALLKLPIIRNAVIFMKSQIPK